MLEPGDWLEIDIRPAAAKYQTQVLIEPTPGGWVLLEVMGRQNYWHQNECRKLTEHEVMEMLQDVGMPDAERA